MPLTHTLPSTLCGAHSRHNGLAGWLAGWLMVCVGVCVCVCVCVLVGQCPIGIEKRQQHLVRFFSGDHALHFACRYQRRDAIKWLVEQNAPCDGEECLNSRGEDPRAVAQTMDGFTDASKTGDFDPIEPLLDPWDTVSVITQGVVGHENEEFFIDLRLQQASPYASEAIVGLFAATCETIKHQIFHQKLIPPSEQRLFFKGTDVSVHGKVNLHAVLMPCYLRFNADSRMLLSFHRLPTHLCC